jgi:hypothetical protein
LAFRGSTDQAAILAFRGLASMELASALMLGNGIRGLASQSEKRSVSAGVGLARHEYRRPVGTSTGLVSKGVQDQVNGAVGSDDTQD